MSFEFVLEVDDLRDDQVDAVEAMSQREGSWPVLSHRRRRYFGVFGAREGVRTLYMPDALDGGQHILTDDAEWDAASWAMEPSLLPLLAQTIRILGDALPQGFGFRATWVGSEVRHEVVLTAGDLADLASTSRLNEFTRYRVPGKTPAPGPSA